MSMELAAVLSGLLSWSHTASTLCESTVLDAALPADVGDVKRTCNQDIRKFNVLAFNPFCGNLVSFHPATAQRLERCSGAVNIHAWLVVDPGNVAVTRFLRSSPGNLVSG